MFIFEYPKQMNHTVFTEGMAAFIDVGKCGHQVGTLPPGLIPRRTGTIRKYFLAIEEIIWDYTPRLTTLTKYAICR